LSISSKLYEKIYFKGVKLVNDLKCQSRSCETQRRKSNPLVSVAARLSESQ